MSNIQGLAEYKARLKAVRKMVGQPGGKAWAKECAGLLRQRVGGMSMPYSGTGLGRYGSRSHPEYRLQPSFKVRAGRMKPGQLSNYTVVGSYHAYFVDAGVKAHSLQSRASRPKGRTVFAKASRSVWKSTARKGHPGYPARPFRAAAAQEALRRQPILDQVIRAWNEAA